MDLDAHAVNQADDVLHLVGVINIAWQMVVHFRKSEETLHFALGDEFSELKLLLFLVHLSNLLLQGGWPSLA